jgi:CDGSH-type Zn-finger protein
MADTNAGPPASTHFSPQARAPSREQLLYWLHEAAEIEHNLMCCYLYAAFSLKRDDTAWSTAERDAVDGGAGETAPPVNTLHVRENGPYAVRAALRIEGHAEAPAYRATLCRCGHSRNKPFCDRSHVAAGFTADGVPA